MKKLWLIALTSALTFLYACNNDTEDPIDPAGPANPTNAVMNISVNGEDHVINSFNNTLLHVDYDVVEGRRLDIRFDLDGVTTTIGVSNFSFQNPPENGVIEKIYSTNIDIEGGETECQSFNMITYCEGADAFYMDGMNTYTTMEIENSEHHITIEECNTISKKISGSFDFVLFDFFGSDSLHCIGTFEHLPYVVMQ